jgi:hypothetical protein
MQAISFVSLVCFVATLPLSQPDDSAEEMKRMGGRFERIFTNGAGATFRAVKEAQGDQSVVTTYDDAGNIVESHTSTFKVEKRGPVRIFSYSKLAVTAGPAKGHTEPATHSYIYRLEGDVFTEVWGLLEGDLTPPRMFQWRRIAENK